MNRRLHTCFVALDIILRDGLLEGEKSQDRDTAKGGLPWDARLKRQVTGTTYQLGGRDSRQEFVEAR
jgi:hypothetical protein